MLLEKNKVYKIRHPHGVLQWWNRKHLLFSPIENIELPDDYFADNGNYKSTVFFTIFTICFDGKINTMYDEKPSQCGFYSKCIMMDLNNDDLNDIRKAIGELGDEWHYNRKLNKIFIKNESN